MFDSQMRALWGWRGILGFINPAVSLSYGAEYAYKFGTLGVGMMETTLGLVHVTDENVTRVLPGLENAAKILADQGAQFVCLNGPPATLVEGTDHNLSLKKRLEEITKLPSTTALLAAKDALKSLSVKKLIIIEPGSSDGLDIWAKREKKFFEDNDFKVLNYKSARSKTTTLVALPLQGYMYIPFSGPEAIPHKEIPTPSWPLKNSSIEPTKGMGRSGRGNGPWQWRAGLMTSASPFGL